MIVIFLLLAGGYRHLAEIFTFQTDLPRNKLLFLSVLLPLNSAFGYKIFCFILAFQKNVLSLHHQKRFGAMNS